MAGIRPSISVELPLSNDNASMSLITGRGAMPHGGGGGVKSGAGGACGGINQRTTGRLSRDSTHPEEVLTVVSAGALDSVAAKVKAAKR
jgi:hypothetical protein